MSAADRPRRVRQAGVVILVLGLALAAFVYWHATGPASDATGYQIVGGQAYAVDESAAQQAQTERMGGHALVMTTRFSHWLGSLWHGERFAWTLGTLSVVASLLCLWIAGLMEEEPTD